MKKSTKNILLGICALIVVVIIVYMFMTLNHIQKMQEIQQQTQLAQKQTQTQTQNSGMLNSLNSQYMMNYPYLYESRPWWYNDWIGGWFNGLGGNHHHHYYNNHNSKPKPPSPTQAPPSPTQAPLIPKFPLLPPDPTLAQAPQSFPQSPLPTFLAPPQMGNPLPILISPIPSLPETLPIPSLYGSLSNPIPDTNLPSIKPIKPVAGIQTPMQPGLPLVQKPSIEGFTNYRAARDTANDDEGRIEKSMMNGAVHAPDLLASQALYKWQPDLPRAQILPTMRQNLATQNIYPQWSPV
jgi:hypothetical protein